MFDVLWYFWGLIFCATIFLRTVFMLNGPVATTMP